MSPLKAIRAKRLDCSNDQWNEVRLCPATDCALHEFRLGRNPNRIGIENAGHFKPRTNSGDGPLDSQLAC